MHTIGRLQGTVEVRCFSGRLPTKSCNNTYWLSFIPLHSVWKLMYLYVQATTPAGV